VRTEKGFAVLTESSPIKGVFLMNANLVSSNLFAAQVRSALLAIADWTDAVANVALVEGTFNPKDSTTYPADSSAFTSLVSGAAWEIQFDALTSRWFLIAPDPDEGWDFVSTAGGITITGFKVWGTDEEDNAVGANLFENPIAIAASGQHVTLPWVTFDITDMIVDALTPYSLP